MEDPITLNEILRSLNTQPDWQRNLVELFQHNNFEKANLISQCKKKKKEEEKEKEKKRRRKSKQKKQNTKQNKDKPRKNQVVSISLAFLCTIATHGIFHGLFYNSSPKCNLPFICSIKRNGTAFAYRSMHLN